MRLIQLLTLLRNPQVDQVVLQESSVPCTRHGDSLHPVSDRAVTRHDIECLLQEAGISAHLAQAGPKGIRDVPFRKDSTVYQADILLKKGQLQLRVYLGQEVAYEPLVFEDTGVGPVPLPPTNDTVGGGGASRRGGLEIRTEGEAFDIQTGRDAFELQGDLDVTNYREDSQAIEIDLDDSILELELDGPGEGFAGDVSSLGPQKLPEQGPFPKGNRPPPVVTQSQPGVLRPAPADRGGVTVTTPQSVGAPRRTGSGVMKTQTAPSTPDITSGSMPSVPLVRDKAALQAIESILTESRRLRASDVHISPGYPAQIRCVSHLEARGSVLSKEQVRKMMLSLLDRKQQAALETQGYTDFAYELPKAGRFRVNVNRQRAGLKGCFRLVPSRPVPLAELGLPEELAKITMHHQGLVVVSGPKGAGKTTSMASLIDLFNQSRPIHIITVEDPIEILHTPKRAVISQREVGRHTQSYATALKGALREDPDVIGIGELRDLETVEMALSAAETGHLVIATMSTPSGAVTIDRLIDMFPQGVQSQVRNTLAGTLKMVISQRLVPSVNGKALHVASELIIGSIPLYAMIRDNKLFQLPSLMQQGRAYGMFRIEDSLNALIQKGRISYEAARANANDPASIIQGGPGTAGGARPPGRVGTQIGLGSMVVKMKDE